MSAGAAGRPGERRSVAGSAAVDGAADAGGALVVRSLLPPPWAELAPLVEESEREGFRFLARLRREFEDGSNRFDAPGEALLGCRRGAGLVALGGLNRDPYSPEPRVGRLRHLYVSGACRRSGVGRMLVDALVAAARPHFGVLLLRTDTAAAARFYEALGFAAVASPHATHRMVLGGSVGRPAAGREIA